MSFHTQANRDAVSVAPSEASTGPRVGFLESWAVAWEEQTRAAAMYGIENQMWHRENEQVRAMRRAGVEHVPMLSPDSMGFMTSNVPGPAAGVSRYLDVARYYTDGGEPGFGNQLEEYDKRILELREQYPDLSLQTSREMWENVQAEAQKYEHQAMHGRRTIAGKAGAFVGGTLAAVNPNTDPFNFLTLGVGGIGRTVLSRIAGQGVGQGAIETVNQVTGVQEQRRLLGLDYGVGDAVSRVAGAAVGGAALQGVGEVAAYGFRRWFRSTPNDPADPPLPELLERPDLPDTSTVPPNAIPADPDLATAKLTRAPETYVDYLYEQSPFSNSRAGRARTVLDADYMTARLEDWNEARPWEIAPKTDTLITRPQSDFVNTPDMGRFVERAQVDEIARRIDPDTFRKYDKLAQEISTYRRWLDELADSRDANTQTRIDEIDTKITKLTAKAEDTGGKRATKVRKDIAKLEADKAQIIEESASKETADMVRIRRELMRADEKMRDMAPVVSRAYARARKKWTNTAADREAIVEMMREGRTNVRTDPQAQRVSDSLAEATPEALSDRAPILQQSYKVADKVRDDADAADIAVAIVQENMKAVDDALLRYRADLDNLIGTEKNGELTLANGRKLNLDKDTVFMPNEEGTGGRELTVRQMLEENRMDEYELEAVGVCSARKTS